MKRTTSPSPDPAPAVGMVRQHPLRRWVVGVPLFLPLMAAVGAAVGSYAWVLAVAAVVAAHFVRQYRVMVCCVLCALLCAVHVGMQQQRAEAARDLWEGRSAVRFEGTVQDVLHHGVILNTGVDGVRVVVRGKDMDFEAGDRVCLVAAPQETRRAMLPGMFDGEAWLRSRGAAAEFEYIRGERLGRSFSFATLRGFGLRCRKLLSTCLMPPGCESDARCQVLCALVLGDKASAEDGTMMDFRRGGCMHAFAVSGLHVGILSGLLWACLRLLRVHPRASKVLLLVLVGVYVVVTGASVSAVRAYLMLAVVLLGHLLRRRVSPANTWCFAALLIILVDPRQCTAPAFQLSFAVYAAICMGVSYCMRDSSLLGPDPFIPIRLYTKIDYARRRADAALRGTVLVSLCAWLVSLPITVAHFHVINTWGFVTNILIAPLLVVTMAAGMLALATSWLPWVGAGCWWAAKLASSWLLAVVGWCGGLPGSFVPDVAPVPAGEAMLVPLGYGNSSAVLGNPGLVLDAGNEISGRLTLRPALFHAGFTPSGVLTTRALVSRSGGVPALQEQWPELKVMTERELRKGITRLAGPAGVYTVYPAPEGLPARVAGNLVPIIRWEHAGQACLFIGDAALPTLRSLPPEALRADVVVLGYNPKMPADDPELLRATGARRFILLPSAAASGLTAQELFPAEFIRMGENSVLRFSLPPGRDERSTDRNATQ